MSRKRRYSTADLIPLIAVPMVVSISPAARPYIFIFIGVALFALAMVVLYFWLTRHSRPKKFDHIIAFGTGQPRSNTLSISTAPDTLSTKLRNLDWYQFEKLVAVLYETKGFSVLRSGGANPDGGVDLVIEREGQKTAVQCKHWRKAEVPVSEIREFLGALTCLPHNLCGL